MGRARSEVRARGDVYEGARTYGLASASGTQERLDGRYTVTAVETEIRDDSLANLGESLGPRGGRCVRNVEVRVGRWMASPLVTIERAYVELEGELIEVDHGR